MSYNKVRRITGVLKLPYYYSRPVTLGEALENLPRIEAPGGPYLISAAVKALRLKRDGDTVTVEGLVSSRNAQLIFSNRVRLIND